MVAYKVLDVRGCMNELLCKETFDFFLLQEMTINTFASFSIDGHRIDEYFTDEETAKLDIDDALMPYEYFREYCFDIIKGKKTPLSFQIILSLPTRIIGQIIEAAELNFQAKEVNLVAIFRFNDAGLIVTTGTSFREFTMDKSLERQFDEWFYNFLTAAGIDVDKVV